MSNAGYSDTESNGSSREAYGLDSDSRNDIGPPGLEYNDGKGIRVTVVLHPAFPRLAPGEKQRKNAKKPEVVKDSIYVHEDTPFNKFLQFAIHAVKQEDSCLKFKVDEDMALLVTNHFTAKWGVFRGQDKDMMLRSEEGFGEMMKRGIEKPDALTVDIYEEERPPLSGSVAATENGDDHSDRRVTKKKKTALTEREEEMAEVVTQIQEKHRCNDEECKNFGKTCFVDNQGAHVFCTHTHLDMWSSAKLEGVAEVDLDHPPKTDMFCGGQNPHYEDLLRTRRGSNRQPLTSTTNIVLPAEAFMIARSPQPHSSNINQSQSQPQPSALAPRMSLFDFCAIFELSKDIYNKLKDRKVGGPQALRFLKDEILGTKLGLEPGEIGGLRDAEDRWSKGLRN